MASLDETYKPLERLIGTWRASGRTAGSAEDNVAGELTAQPVLDGKFLELRGRLEFAGIGFPSLEIIHFDPETGTFPSEAFAAMGDGPGGAPTPYEWRVDDDGTVIHRGAGATYSGRFSADGTELTGGWRPDKGSDERSQANYDLTMHRV